MRKAFTLIEMLIVVALIATLMTIVFRLSSVSANEERRNRTVLRLARLENCLSGYYAAYGNYPPVRLHNTRDIYQKADGHGVQSTGDVNENLWGWSELNEVAEQEAWNQVKAACQSQPIGAEFPFSKTDQVKEDIENLRETLQQNLASGSFKNYPKAGTPEYQAVMAGFDGLQENLGRFQNAGTAIDWRDIQVFKFGLISFLLPRYQMMMAGNRQLYTAFAQWTKNNGAVSNYQTGKTFSWSELNALNEKRDRGEATKQDEMMLENIPTDAPCARWLPNLEGCCRSTRSEVKFYGVNIIDPLSSASANFFLPSDDPESGMPELHIYSPHGDSTRDQYILDSITVLDGWGNEFYYYSPSPHQTYHLWSAGPNGRTFPPWISRQQLSSQANECVFKWTQDDIKGLNY